jgi:hypothetical protein
MVKIALTKDVKEELKKEVDLRDITVRWCINNPTFTGKIPEKFLGGKTQTKGREQCSKVRRIIFKKKNALLQKLKIEEEEKKKKEAEEFEAWMRRHNPPRIEIIKDCVNKIRVIKSVKEMTRIYSECGNI